MSFRIEPPLDGPLLKSLREYVTEEHEPEREPDAPDLHCPWNPSGDGSLLRHAGEPSATDAAWLSYLIELFFAGTGHKLSGKVEGITCTNNIITTT